MCGDNMDDFAVIYRTHSPGLYKYIYYQTGNKHIAEELLQETFFQAYKSLSRFRGDAKLSTWLFGIARNVLHREWGRKQHMSPGHRTDPHTPESIFSDQESEQELLRALDQLPSPYREVVILRIFNELSFREIGEVLQRDENWARVTFYRAKLKLKTNLEEEV